MTLYKADNEEGATRSAAGQNFSEDVQQAIARAKQDWESTADNLPHVVCLVDEQGRVVRVNRAIESWGLGRVNEVTGRDIHDLLHCGSCEADCQLRECLLDAWARTRGGTSVELELVDAVLGRALSILLRPIGGSCALRPDGQARAAVIVTDVTPLHVARMALVKLNEHLEARVRERTCELEHANRDLQNEIARRESAEDALRQSRNELELLSQQLIQAQECERRRIAQELHDSVGQSLSAIKYSLERAAELLRQDRHYDARPLLNRTVERVRHAMTDIRGIAMNLRPPVLDDLGVASALEWLCREFGETYAHIAVRTRISAADTDIPQRLVTTIFRCAQELLNNVAKHSRATEVTVTLARDANIVSLGVCDDGCGLPSADSSGSFGVGHGIRNLRERAQMTGGNLTLSSEPGGGTRAGLDWRSGPGELKV
jgi:signal transduction histidine kinase